MKTFDEILKELERIATEKFNLSNIKYSKTGILGFLVYLLGYFRYDIKQYYDYLFDESNIVTARTRKTLLRLASLFGYTTDFAKPAIFQGNLYIYVPNTNDSNSHYIYIPSHTEFIIDNLIWTLYDNIHIEFDNITNTGVANIIKEDGEHISLPIKLYELNPSTKFIVIPNPSIKQEKRTIYKYIIPFYYFGTFHTLTLNAQDFGGKYFSDLKVYVKQPDNDEYIEFEIVQNRYLYGKNDNVVFIETINDSEIQLIFGSGINGLYIPKDSEIKIEIKTTNGSEGNIDAENEIFLYSKDKVLLDNILVTNPEFIKLVVTNKITTGRDLPTINELKRDIITFIKVRNTVVTRNDIISRLKDIGVESYVTCKTHRLFTPTIYIYAAFESPLKLPIRHTTYFIEKNKLNNSIFIPENYIVEYETKGLYPVDTFSRVVQQISENKFKVDNIRNLSRGSKISFKNTYYVNNNELFTVTDIDTENNIITVDKILNFDPTGLSIYEYKKYKLNCLIPFFAVYESKFNRFRTYLKLDMFTLLLEKLNDRNFVFIPSLSINIDNIEKLNDGSFRIIFRIELLNSNEIPPDYNEKISDLLQIFIPKYNKTFTISDILIEKSKTFEYHVNSEDELFELLNSLNEIEIHLTIFDLLSNIEISKYNLKTKFIFDTTELVNLVIDGDKIFDVPIFEQNDFEIFRDYIKTRLLNIVDNICVMDRMPGTEYKLLLTNTIELTDNYTKHKEQFSNILLPLQLKIKIIINSSKRLTTNQFTTIDEYIEYLKEQLALHILSNEEYNGIEVKYYPTKIIEFLKDLDSQYGSVIEQIEVLQPDIYIDVDVEDINKYESENIKTKEQDLLYIPTYFWFDVNNIEVRYEII